MTTPPPTDSDVRARLDRLEQQQPKRAEPAKDVWDIVQIVGAALIPVAIAAGGWFYSEASSRAQIESARQQHERDAEIATADARVRQAGLLKDFLDALTGPDQAKRRVAIQAVLLALPQDGPNLVRELSQSTPDSGTAQFARDALIDRCVSLVRRLFAATPDDRKDASKQLVDGYGKIPWMVDTLLAYTRQHLDNDNGVFNAAGVLTQISPDVLAAKRPTIEAFLDDADRSPAAGPKIHTLIRQARARLGSS